MAKLVAQAELEWERAATDWMAQVGPAIAQIIPLRLAGIWHHPARQVLATLRALRPKARFGYYGLPQVSPTFSSAIDAVCGAKHVKASLFFSSAAIEVVRGAKAAIEHHPEFPDSPARGLPRATSGATAASARESVTPPRSRPRRWPRGGCRTTSCARSSARAASRTPPRDCDPQELFLGAKKYLLL